MIGKHYDFTNDNTTVVTMTETRHNEVITKEKNVGDTTIDDYMEVVVDFLKAIGFADVVIAKGFAHILNTDYLSYDDEYIDDMKKDLEEVLDSFE